MPQKVYLDDNGNPSTKTYLDDSGNPIAPKTQPPAPTMYDRLKDSTKMFMDLARSMNMPVDSTIGAAKELGSTVWNTGKKLQETNPVPPIGPANGRTPLNQPIIPMADKKPAYLEPSNGMQQLGGAATTAAEFAAPSMMAAKAPAVAGMGLAGRSALEAALAGTVGTARGEAPKQALTDALTAGGGTAIMGTIAKVLPTMGESIETTLLKPLSAELKQVKGPPEEAQQTMVKNLFKYDLGGTLDQSFKKASAKTAELGQQLKAALGNSPTPNVDIYQALVDTSHELGANTAKNFGTNAEIQKAVNKMLGELQTITQTGMVNIADAQDMKQAVGYMGSWNHGVRDADSTAMETVANTLYSKIRAAIESASGQSQQVKDINRQFNEIIPIKNAILRRIPVEARREIISLKEAIGIATLNPAGMGLSLADRALRNGSVANALVQAGKAPAATGAVGGVGLTGLSRALQDSMKGGQ